jgi:hypothetical protein
MSSLAAFFDGDQLGTELAARAVVPRDDARDGCLLLDRRIYPHGHGAPGAKPASSGRLVDLDRGRAHPAQVARLPDPGKLVLGRPAQPPEEDLGQSVALAPRSSTRR